jgi:hypothetical protein
MPAVDGRPALGPVLFPNSTAHRRRLPGATASQTRTSVLVRQLKSEQVNVQRAAVQELLLLASTSNVLGAAIRHASGDRQLMRVVHRHSSSATIYSANWSLLRWSLATLNALAVDDISRKRQAPIIESAISVCVQGLDLDAEGDGFGSPAVPDARHAVAEAASLIANLRGSAEPRAVLERIGGLERLVGWAASFPRSGILKTLQHAGLIEARSLSALPLGGGVGVLTHRESSRGTIGGDAHATAGTPLAGQQAYASATAHGGSASTPKSQRRRRPSSEVDTKPAADGEAGDDATGALSHRLQAGHMLSADEIRELRLQAGHMLSADEIRELRLQAGQDGGAASLGGGVGKADNSPQPSAAARVRAFVSWADWPSGHPLFASYATWSANL